MCCKKPRFQLENKNVFITGGSKGIGKETVKLLLNEGSNVYSISRTPSGIKHEKLFEYLCDLSTLDNLRSMLFLHDIPKIDVLINNIGYNPGVKCFEKYTEEEIDKCIILNITSHLYFLRKLSPKKVVFVNSMLGLVGVNENALYCASKAFIKSFNDSLRNENVDCYIIHPSKVDTEMFNEIKDIAYNRKEIIAETIVKDIKFNKKIRYVPFYVRFIPFIRKILPVCLFDGLMRFLFKCVKKNKE
ncbi:yueD [Nucleospora cyclopteri]